MIIALIAIYIAHVAVAFLPIIRYRLRDVFLNIEVPNIEYNQSTVIHIAGKTILHFASQCDTRKPTAILMLCIVFDVFMVITLITDGSNLAYILFTVFSILVCLIRALTIIKLLENHTKIAWLYDNRTKILTAYDCLPFCNIYRQCTLTGYNEVAHYFSHIYGLDVTRCSIDDDTVKFIAGNIVFSLNESPSKPLFYRNPPPAYDMLYRTFCAVVMTDEA